MQFLKDKVVIITGASQGVGSAAAALMAGRGAAVVLNARRGGVLRSVVEGIRQSGGEAAAVAGDVSDPAQVKTLVEETIARYGKVDVLVNNAAVIRPFGKVWEADPDAWLQLLKINVYGSFLCAREVLPGMLARNWGRIINISSGVADYNLTGTSAYNSSKAALERFSGTLAEEVNGSGVVVTALRPGKVDTGMQVDIRQTPDKQFPRAEEWREVHRKGQLLDPKVPGSVICWLAGKFGAHLNGETLSVKDSDFMAQVARELAID